MRRSIKLKLTAFVTTIIIFIIGIQILFNQQYATPFFIHEKTTQIEQLYLELAISLNNVGGDVKKIITPYEENDHIRVAIWDDEGETIYSSNIEELAHYQKASIKFREQPSVKYRANYRTGEESLMILGLIKNNTRSYHIVIETPISAVHHSVELILKLNLIIAMGVLLIGSICAWWFGKRFTKPILEIDRVAQAVTDLDFSKKVSASLREDEIGKLGNNINLMSDQLADLIGKLQLANEQLEKDIDYQKQIDNMRKEFIANVSHELKSPLALLTMSCENLKGDLPHIDKEFYCDIIIDECLRLGQLVKNLLDISALENGIVSMNPENFDFASFTRWICLKNKAFFYEQNIIVKTNIAHNLHIYGDKFYLEQAVTNYLDNAKTHTKENSVIEIGLEREEENVKFYIFNEGDSISEDHIDRIWESFYKVDLARTHSNEMHTGLGLYIVRTIIASHGGTYGVRNRDNGVEFWFRLPL